MGGERGGLRRLGLVGMGMGMGVGMGVGGMMGV